MSCGYSHVNNPATNSAREILMKKCEKYNVPLAHFLFSPFEESVKNSIEVGAKVLVAGGDVSLFLQICKDLRSIIYKII